MSNLRAAKGNTVTINFGAGTRPTFTAGGSKRHVIEKVRESAGRAIGVVMVNGLLRFADGTEAFALLEIDEASSGEHCGTGVFLPDGGFIWADDDGFADAMGKSPDQIFPYRYRYTGTVRAPRDHHIGADGWSL